jgi:hypothetical protein
VTPRIAMLALAGLIASLVLLGSNAEAHDGTNGYIQWADIHWNLSGTGHLEYDWYYTGHEGCQGDDACVFYTTISRYTCVYISCAWSTVGYVGHGTVHGWLYDHSAIDGSASCQTLTHYDGWDCHNTSGQTQPCGSAYRHRPTAYTPYQTPISTGPLSNYVYKLC